MAEHGTRARYKAGCGCLTCRAANATYQVVRRRLWVMGRLSADCRIEARETWRQVRWLLNEGFTRSAVARALGRRTRECNLGRRWVTVRTAVRIDRLYRSHAEEWDFFVGMGHKK